MTTLALIVQFCFNKFRLEWGLQRKLSNASFDAKQEELQSLKQTNVSLQTQVDNREELIYLLRSKDGALQVLAKTNEQLERKVKLLETKIAHAVKTLKVERKEGGMSIVLKCVALGWAHLERSSRPLEPLFAAYAVTDMATIYIFGGLVGICILLSILV